MVPNYRGIKTLKGQVEYVLRTNTSSRNDDVLLMVCVWREFYGGQIMKTPGGQDCIPLSALWTIPREDNIKRFRAYFQNEDKKYLPTREDVAKKRRLIMDEWRVAMGYPTKETSGTDKPIWTPPSEQQPL